MDNFFPTKTTVRNEKDTPWINKTVKRLARKKRKVWEKEGRSANWRNLDKQSRELRERRANVYMKSQRQDFLGTDAAKNFYKNVRAYESKEKPPNFNPRDLFPGETDKGASEKLADHFTQISNEFSGVDSIPDAPHSPLPVLTRAQVEKRLLEFKKSKTRVIGDLFPSIVSGAAASLSVPLTDLYNKMSDTKEWPSDWKLEYVTVIPKTSHPESVNDVRNILCTLFVSKVYESFLLKWLTDKMGLATNQFAGVEGCSSEHYLALLWQKVLENLEDKRAASLLTTVDYSKAFNRLNF